MYRLRCVVAIHLTALYDDIRVRVFRKYFLLCSAQFCSTSLLCHHHVRLFVVRFECLCVCVFLCDWWKNTSKSFVLKLCAADGCIKRNNLRECMVHCALFSAYLSVYVFLTDAGEWMMAKRIHSLECGVFDICRFAKTTRTTAKATATATKKECQMNENNLIRDILIYERELSFIPLNSSPNNRILRRKGSWNATANHEYLQMKSRIQFWTMTAFKESKANSAKTDRKASAPKNVFDPFIDPMLLTPRFFFGREWLSNAQQHILLETLRNLSRYN